MWRRLSFCSSMVAFVLIQPIFGTSACEDVRVNCRTELRWGQFMCPDPDSNYEYIDKATQQPIGCTKENKAIG